MVFPIQDLKSHSMMEESIFMIIPTIKILYAENVKVVSFMLEQISVPVVPGDPRLFCWAKARIFAIQIIKEKPCDEKILPSWYKFLRKQSFRWYFICFWFIEYESVNKKCFKSEGGNTTGLKRFLWKVQNFEFWTDSKHDDSKGGIGSNLSRLGLIKTGFEPVSARSYATLMWFAALHKKIQKHLGL